MEAGIDSNDELSKSGKGWPTVSSIMDLFNQEKISHIENTSLSPAHAEPIIFLQRQQQILLYDRLPQLVKLHGQYLQSGDPKLSQTRNEILNLISEMNENFTAINELYSSEKYFSLNKYQQFRNWINDKSKLNDKISQITLNSKEGKMYTSLEENLIKLDNEIFNLEAQLKILKKKKKLLNVQFLETKSLLDIKLNSTNDELESLSIMEKEEINLMFKTQQIDSPNLTDLEVSSKLKQRLDFFDNLIKINLNSMDNFKNSSLYLSNIFTTLENMESTIQTFLLENNIPQLEKTLITSRIYLKDSIKDARSFNLSPIQTLILNELDAIEKAMKLLNIEIQPDETEDLFEKTEPNIYNDNSDNHYESSNENIQLVNATKQSLQIQNRISTSPPGITNTNAVVIPKSSIKKNLKFKPDTNKYDLLLSEIKTSKGNKTD